MAKIPSRSPSVPSLTVREIAERIRKDGEALPSVIDRLRNWTDEGLLSIVGDRNPGTGKPRRYAQIALVEALALTELSKFVPVTGGVSRVVRASAEDFKGEKGFLIFSRKSNGEFSLGIVSKPASLGSELENWDYDAHLVLSLAKLHKRAKSDP